MAIHDSRIVRHASRLFDRYPLTGRTYTTASGTVIPNELQYYDGEMAHFYGECANVSAVRQAVAGSGYRPVILRYADGREAAVAQVWTSRFTDTTIQAYNAMFIVVVVVRDTPGERAWIQADANGASSAVVMFDGSFDQAAAVYENHARLFLVRLLDTTQVAIDVGRERMGTDKRPGTIDMTTTGRWLHVSIADADRRGVLRADVGLAADPAAVMPAIGRAAETAGIVLRTLPPSTEYSYPAVARIGRKGKVVCWEWRTDAVPRLQPIAPGTVVLDGSSEEGQMLRKWAFTPKMLAYFPQVRGVVTGLADPGQPVSLLRAAATRSPADRTADLPVLRLVAIEGAAAPGAAATPPAYGAAAGASAPRPRYAWSTTFLGSLTAFLRKEVVGVTPDGLRINWHVTSGTFNGPGLDAVVLPGAADWMRIRRDGVAIVSVQACFETTGGARVYGSYGGIFDLGPDGYIRALRDEYPHLPPVVVTPTYATADARFDWINRAQCVGVGRVDMAALRVEFDVFVVKVGDRLPQSPADTITTGIAPGRRGSLYDRLGGQQAIAGITDDFVGGVLADRQLARFFPGPLHPGLRERVIELLCQITGGPCEYRGRDMKTAHRGLGITRADWDLAVVLFTRALDSRNVAPPEQAEFLKIIQNMKDTIVEVPDSR